jgi:NADPH-dependent F420 reductase
MRLGFIGGTGDEGMGLAYRFALAGHECVIGSRSRDKAAAAADELRARDASLRITGAENTEAAASGEVVLVTTPYSAQRVTLPPLAPALAGKIVVSTVVPMQFERGSASLLSVKAGSAAQEEQELLRQSTVVAAFQNLSARKLLKGGAIDADVVVCADNGEARTRIMDLAQAIEGVRGIDGGPLANAAFIEGITVLLVAINRAYKTQAGIRIAGV